MNNLPIEPLATPILSFRSWHGDEGGLRSLSITGHYWKPGVNNATDYQASQLDAFFQNDASSEMHQCDGVHDCQLCGFHGFKHPELLVNEWPTDVYGVVEMWGKVTEHHLGFRSQYARIRALVVMSLWRAPVVTLRELYQVPVERCSFPSRRKLTRMLTRQANALSAAS